MANSPTRVACKPTDKRWEGVLRKEVKDVQSVELDTQCDLPDHTTALTAFVFQNGEHAEDAAGLFIFDNSDKLIRHESQGFTSSFESTCELLFYQDGYLFTRCNFSEGGGIGIFYSAYRIADGESATIASITGGIDHSEKWKADDELPPPISSEVSTALENALKSNKSMYPYTSPHGTCHIPNPNEEDNAIGDHIEKLMSSRKVFRSIFLTCTIGKKQFSIYEGPVQKDSYNPTDIGYVFYDSSRIYGSGSFLEKKDDSQSVNPARIAIHIDEKYVALFMKIIGPQNVETAEYQLSLSTYNGGKLYSERTYKNKDLCGFMGFPCDEVLGMK